MSNEEENPPSFLRTKQGEVIPPYQLLHETEARPSVDIYLVHRGPDTKRDVVEPVAHLLKTLGVPSFCDSLPELYSMPLGHDKVLSMRRGLSFCRLAVVLLSERFCDSPYCVKEVNTLLLREHREKRNIIIPALYTGSLEDSAHAPIFGNRSTLVRRSESSRGFARKLVETVLRRLDRPVPCPNLLRYYLNEHQNSLQDIEDDDSAPPLSVNYASTARSSFSSLSTHTVVGPPALEWKRPFSVPRHFLYGSVGREHELSDLHNRLRPPPGSGESHRGSSAALHGSAGMGKTVLAALYAERYGSNSKENECCYPGGVLWLTIGPQRRMLDDAIWVWQEMIQQTFPELLLQDKGSKDGKVYEAEEVRNLLSYHPNRTGTFRSESPLLVVVDDVWGEEILTATLKALPLDCRVIVTTRDADVAFALEKGEESIFRLDVLSEQDAICLLQSKVRDLKDDTAKTLSRGMGCHAQALTLAAGTLSNRRRLGYDKVVEKILNHLNNGDGFGGLPRLGRRASSKERTVVEKALDVSYDCLQCDDGSERLQEQFRALGVFAQEAEFSTDAAAHVWEVDEDDALEFLVMLEALALVKMTSSAPNVEEAPVRWQQHAVLRAYEQSLWSVDSEDVRLAWKSKHAHFFAALIEDCMQKRPRDFDGIDAELRQIQHAFSWCKDECAELVIKFVTSMSKYLIVRGCSGELESWLERALEIAGERDATNDKANILRTMGDIQLQLGRFDRSRVYLEQALALFDALNDEDVKSSGKALTLHSIGDVEYRMGRLTSSSDFFTKALSLFRLAGDRWGEGVALRSLGDVKRFLGNAQDARTHLAQAINIFSFDCNMIGEAGAVLALGRVESRVGDWDEALVHFDRCFALYESTKSKLGQGSTWKCKGDIFLKKAMFEEAKKCYEQALPLFTAMSDKLGEAQTLRCLGDLQLHLGLLGDAEKYLKESLRIYVDLDSERGKANTLRSLAAVEIKKGNRQGAYVVYEEAKVLFARILLQLGQNDWKHLDQVEYELQSLDSTSTSSFETSAWTLDEAMQQPYGSAQTLDILSEVER